MPQKKTKSLSLGAKAKQSQDKITASPGAPRDDKMAEGSLAWQAPEFAELDRGPLWYALAGLAFIGLMLLALLVMHDIFVAVIVIVCAFAVIYHQQMRPRTLNYRIDIEGVHVGGNSYTPAQIKSYYFTHEPSLTLNIEIKSRALPLAIALAGLSEVQVRAALTSLAQEDRTRTEDTMTRLLRILKL